MTPEVKRLVERAAAAGEGRGAEARAGDVARLAPGAARRAAGCGTCLRGWW